MWKPDSPQQTSTHAIPRVRAFHGDPITLISETVCDRSERRTVSNTGFSTRCAEAGAEVSSSDKHASRINIDSTLVQGGRTE